MLTLSKQKTHALVLTGLVFSATAMATEHKAYVQLNAGAVFAPSYSETVQNYLAGFNGFTAKYKEDYDTGYAASVAVGYRLADAFRLEGELMYQSNKIDKVHVSTNYLGFPQSGTFDLKGDRERSAFLLNSYYDFKNSSAFTPYITGGMGAYHLNIKRPGLKSDNILDFAWQVGTGLNYKMDDNISFDLKYRYLGGADAEMSYRDVYEVGDHQVMGGIRVGF